MACRISTGNGKCGLSTLTYCECDGSKEDMDICPFWNIVFALRKVDL